MNTFATSTIISIGLAIFSMLFGAGNLMYPLQVGMSSGNQTFIGIAGFIVTAVLLPVIGFLSMILFDGNYKDFFYRLGKPIGSFMIFACMMIIGPGIAMPRITTLSHTMTAPFIPVSFLTTINPYSSLLFAMLFLGITFLLTYRENRIVSLLGSIISPLLLISLAIIIVKGMLFPGNPMHQDANPWVLFINNMRRGYETLDLLGALFFSSIIISLLKSNFPQEPSVGRQALLSVALKSSLIGVSLLGLVYIGMSLLGMYHGSGFEGVNAGELFRAISFKVLGAQGCAVIATAVFMACLSTAIALSAVVAEYVQQDLFGSRISFVTSLTLVLVACLPLSVVGLTKVLQLTGGIITYVGYPVLIALTVCNIAYKLWGMRFVKLPVLIVFIASLASYLHDCSLLS